MSNKNKEELQQIVQNAAKNEKDAQIAENIMNDALSELSSEAEQNNKPEES